MSAVDTIAGDLQNAVLLGDFIPDHDKTWNLASEVGLRLQEFHAYVTEVRDRPQADDALTELGKHITTAIYNAIRPADADRRTA
jgi:hypothetical protein